MTDTADAPEVRERRFRIALAVVVLGAATIRIVFALGTAGHMHAGMDADFYRSTAKALAAGEGFVFRPAEMTLPSTDDTTLLYPATDHVPGHSIVLAASDLMGMRSDDSHRVVLSLLDAVGVGAVGLLGRRIAGRRAGLVAAAVTAAHPLWFQAAGFVASESTYLFAVPVLLLVTHVALSERRTGWYVAAGVCAGLTALVRSEAVVFIASTLLLTLVFSAKGRRLVPILAVSVAALATLAPWLVWMRHTTGVTTLSTNGGVTLVGSYCDTSFYGPKVGSFGTACGMVGVGWVQRSEPPGLDRGHSSGYVDVHVRRYAIDFLENHKTRFPTVAAARLARTAGVFRIDQSIAFDKEIGGDPPIQRVGYVVNWVLMPLAFAGAVLLARRRAWLPLGLLGSGIVVAVVSTLAFYGATRMRAPAEPAIAILAAITFVTAFDSVAAAASGKSRISR